MPQCYTVEPFHVIIHVGLEIFSWKRLTPGYSGIFYCTPELNIWHTYCHKLYTQCDSIFSLYSIQTHGYWCILCSYFGRTTTSLVKSEVTMNWVCHSWLQAKIAQLDDMLVTNILDGIILPIRPNQIIIMVLLWKLGEAKHEYWACKRLTGANLCTM